MEVLLDDLTNFIRVWTDYVHILNDEILRRYNSIESVKGVVIYLIAIKNRFPLGVYQFEF